ncbi:MAG: oligosaccharide flippase family protein [Verrucomicrobiota bacterium]
MTPDSPEDSSAGSSRRNRAISHAVLTSLASKVGTLILQFVSIPIAYRTLGPESFGLYSTIAVGVSTLILFQIGIGPALTHGLSKAISKNDKLLEKQYFSTSWFLLLALTALGGLIAATILLLVPLTSFLGSKYAGLEEQLLPGLWLGLAIVLLEFILSHAERAREGFLEVHINNLFGTAGNILGALTIAIGIHFFPTIEFLILGVFGTRALARLANSIHLFIQRPDLLPKLTYYQKPLAREMLSDGFAFTVSQSITSIIELNVCALIVARFAGPIAVGHFNILMQIAALMTGLIIMFTTPTWPAIADALARLDLTWIKRIIKRLWLLVSGLAIASLLGLTLLGPPILPLIYGKEFQPSWLLLLAFAVYFAASSWGHTNNSILVGLGLVKKAAAVALLETILLLIPAALGMAFFDLPGLFFGMALAMLLVTTWIFPRMIHQFLQKQSQEHNTPSMNPDLATEP